MGSIDVTLVEIIPVHQNKERAAELNTFLREYGRYLREAMPYFIQILTTEGCLDLSTNLSSTSLKFTLHMDIGTRQDSAKKEYPYLDFFLDVKITIEKRGIGPTTAIHGVAKVGSNWHAYQAKLVTGRDLRFDVMTSGIDVLYKAIDHIFTQAPIRY